MKKIWPFFVSVFLSVNIQAQITVPAADEVLQTAYKEAAEQHKNILLMFTASWCVWCKKMDASLNDSTCRKYFTDNYIIVHLAIFETGAKKKLENKGADSILKKYNGEFDTGIPFWVILDKNGSLLADGYIRAEDGKKSSIGCPATEREVAAFIKILGASSPLTEKEISAITRVFRKNERK